MKILLINKYYYLKGGSETYLFNLQKLLEAHGHQVVIFTMDDKRNLPIKNRKFLASAVDFSGGWRAKLAWAGRQLWSWGAVQPLAKLIKKEKPDLVHCHNIYHQLGPNILKVCKKYRLPVVMTLHDFKLICPNYQLFTQGKVCERCKKHQYFQCAKNRCLKNSLAGSFLAMVEMYWHQVLFKTYLKNVDRFIVPSRFMLEKMISWGWPREKFTYLPNFISTSQKRFLDSSCGLTRNDEGCCHLEFIPSVISTSPRHGEVGTVSRDTSFSCSSSRANAVSREISFCSPTQKEKYALYFGRLSYEKGVDILIKAWSKVKGDYQLIIAGCGPQTEELEKLVLKLKISKRVKFVGFQSGDDLNNLIQKASLHIIPSRIYEN